MNNIRQNLEHIQDKLGQFPNAGLLAVSKTQSPEAIKEAYASGQRAFGENYLQEALSKIEALKGLDDLEWHYIGPIQSNKCKAIAEHFQWVQSLDRMKVAKKLNQHCPEGKKLNVCIQINIDDESQKAGIHIEDLDTFAKELSQLKHLQLRGLMTIPSAKKSVGETQQSFAKLAQEFLRLKQNYSQIDTLSMGMSKDYLLALEAGSTLIRLGTSIFGERKTS